MTSARIASRWSAALALVAALSFPNPGLGQTDDPFALYARVLELRQAGNLDEAIALAKRVVELSEKHCRATTPSSKPVATIWLHCIGKKGTSGALNRRVAALYRAGKIAEAAPLAERMLRADSRTEKGEDHADTASGMVAAIEPTETASAERRNNDFAILLAQGGRVAARGATAWPACGIERRDLHGHPVGVPVVGRVGACPDGRAVFQRRWRAFPAGSRASGRVGIMAAARQGADSRTLRISGKAQCRGRASAPVAYCRDRATPHRARRIPGQGLSRVCGAGSTRAAFLQSHARAASNGRGLDPIRQ